MNQDYFCYIMPIYGCTSFYNLNFQSGVDELKISPKTKEGNQN
jgi:hypothetical protein